MSVDAVAALREGFGRLATSSGAVVAGLFVLVGLVEVPVRQALSVHLWERLLRVDGLRSAMRDHYGDVVVPENPFALDVAAAPAVGALVALFVAVAVVRLVAIRTFATEATASPFPTARVRDGFGRTLVALLAFEVGVVVVAGVLLLGPGVTVVLGGGRLALAAALAYLLVTAAAVAAVFLLYFARQAIVLDGAGPLSAVRASYVLCRSNLGSILVLLVAVFAVDVVGSLGIGIVLPDGHVAPIVSTVYQRVVAVYGIAVATQAYGQTR